jgi:histidyl-tRNA synthetase
MALKFQAPRGTRDLLPEELGRWQWAERLAFEVLDHYGYAEIRTPVFEDHELFARSSGETSDVVQKEMYRFKDLKGRELALRPEGTASVCRAYLEHSLSGQGKVHKLWYAGPMMRYGRPQKGRYRQFHQIGAECIGVAAPQADVEMIALFVDIFEAWGFENLTVAVNSVGTPEIRARYGDRLRAWLAPVRDRLSAESQQRLDVNPMRVLDSKDPGDIAFLTGKAGDLEPLPRLIDALDPPAAGHWKAVRDGLDAIGITYEVDHGLVRGLDYYTHTAFEVHDRSLGAQSALGGGGRYDGLIEALGGPPTPGVGFSIGLDRAMLVLAERGVTGDPPRPVVFIVGMDATQRYVHPLARALRQAYTVEFDLEARGTSTQMKAAGRRGAAAVVMLGEDEWQRGEVVVRDMKLGEQETVILEGLPERLDRIMGLTGEVRAE